MLLINVHFVHRDQPRQTRGGARKTSEYDKKKAAIVEHISTFTCRASHYTRRGTPGRKYLPSDMSVKQMHAMFARQNDAQVQVTYSLYYSIFCYKFNLGFGHPVTDVCATCASYKLHCKDQLAAEEDRRREAASYILHRRRARVFYDMLNATDEASVTVCFDMMQNLSLPKTPIGQAYYSRQLSMYVFGVVVHHGRGGGQSKEDVHLYVWQENENRKDSNMVASALNNCLRHCLLMLNDAGSLRLFSDSCFGQNKNMNMLAMLFALRKQCFPRINIKYVFPTAICQPIVFSAASSSSCATWIQCCCPATTTRFLRTTALYTCTGRTGGPVTIVLPLPGTPRCSGRSASAMHASSTLTVMQWV